MHALAAQSCGLPGGLPSLAPIDQRLAVSMEHQRLVESPLCQSSLQHLLQWLRHRQQPARLGFWTFWAEPDHAAGHVDLSPRQAGDLAAPPARVVREVQNVLIHRRRQLITHGKVLGVLEEAHVVRRPCRSCRGSHRRTLPPRQRSTRSSWSFRVPAASAGETELLRDVAPSSASTRLAGALRQSRGWGQCADIGPRERSPPRCWRRFGNRPSTQPERSRRLGPQVARRRALPSSNAGHWGGCFPGPTVFKWSSASSVVSCHRDGTSCCDALDRDHRSSIGFALHMRWPPSGGCSLGALVRWTQNSAEALARQTQPDCNSRFVHPSAFIAFNAPDWDERLAGRKDATIGTHALT